MPAFSWKRPRRQLGLFIFNLLLVLNIGLLSLGLLLSFVYVDHQCLPDKNLHDADGPGHRPRLFRMSADANARVYRNYPNDGDTDEIIIQRRHLTKATYPSTLTAPFLIENPQICDGNVTVLIIVHTSPEHFHRRSGLRQSIGNVNLFKAKFSVRIAFFLGQSKEILTKRMVQEENAKNGDIVVGDFMDSYHNLTLKGVLAFRWVTHHCSHAKLVVKMDDDIYVNIFTVLDYYVPTYSKKKYQILCNKMYPLPIHRFGSKWRLDPDLFRGHKYYPPFCSGFTVLMTTDIVRVMYRAAQITPVFWVDDVYLFGLLPSKFNISQVKINKDVSLNLRRCEASYNSTKPDVHSCPAPTLNHFEFYWNQTLASLSASTRELMNETILTDGLLTRVMRLRGSEKWPLIFSWARSN